MDSGIAIAALAKRKRRFRIERKRPFAPSGTAHLHLYTAGVRRSEWKQKIRFTFWPDFAIITPAEYAPVAQLDRVTDSDSVGQRFESARAYHKKPAVRQVFLLCAADSRFIPERGNPLGRTTKSPLKHYASRGFLYFWNGIIYVFPYHNKYSRKGLYCERSVRFFQDDPSAQDLHT